ncbi:concanavalin A-like lectin/glucanase domain-containing protein, partial [Dichotomocladium elegans]
RANASIPPECEIFYYEVTVVDEADFNYIGIGFCSREAPLDQLPGWHGLSWGYHGDDGRAFEARYGPVDLTDDAFGPQFTLADAIGCGIDVENQLIFYTKNGEFLGLAFESFTSTSGLYPCVGLNAPNTCVVANFGALPFLFD